MSNIAVVEYKYPLVREQTLDKQGLVIHGADCGYVRRGGHVHRVGEVGEVVDGVASDELHQELRLEALEVLCTR